jgi:chemotaxis protein methyltransferase CheR
MIYFGKGLQDRVHDLFYESLETFGVLALGHKESIKFTPREAGFEQLNPKERLYRKIR